MFGFLPPAVLLHLLAIFCCRMPKKKKGDEEDSRAKVIKGKDVGPKTLNIIQGRSPASQCGDSAEWTFPRLSCGLPLAGRLRTQDEGTAPVLPLLVRTMSTELDPQEVLFHLQQLGFRDVDPQQLAEFMRDLTKLMNHDRQKRCRCSCTCRARRSSPVSSDSAYMDTSSSSSSSSGSSSTSCKSPVQDRENVQAATRPPHRTRHDTVTLSDRDENVDTSSVCTSVSSITKGDCPKGSKAQPKNIKSTFIRPWQVDQGSGGRRCDPVALYHHYRALWSKQSFPGEDDHADLRWTIRHRMLGQDPRPRPRGESRATSVESLARRRPRL